MRIYRYILCVDDKKISVEAWPKEPTPEERRRPSFIIGKLETRTYLIYYLLQELRYKYNTRKTKTGYIIYFPNEAINEAYQVGFTLAILAYAQTDEEGEKMLHYMEVCTAEEV